MIKIDKTKWNDLKGFFLLWISQAISQLGTSLTSLALTIWLYEKTGSALSTAALTIFTYLPYVLISLFAGALIDRLDKKKTILVCDLIAAIGTLCILFLYKTESLKIWHLYLINIASGIMNTIQSPASEVALSLIVDKKYYQLTSSLTYLSRSIISVIGPIIATSCYALFHLEGVIYIDLTTFLIAFITLLFFIQLPQPSIDSSESFIVQTKQGFAFLKENRLVFDCILFMSGVNLVASGFDAAIPAYVIPNPNGGTIQLGIVNSCAGIAMIVGSFIASILPKPKNRVRVIYLTMLFSLGTENFILPLSRNPIVWYVAQFIGWFVVPIMSASMNVIIRNNVPIELQGRVFACRNSFQFFTIPIGMFLSGILIDNVFEPFMVANQNNAILTTLFGVGKGSGAGLVILLLGFVGLIYCLVFGKILEKHSYVED